MADFGNVPVDVGALFVQPTSVQQPPAKGTTGPPLCTGAMYGVTQCNNSSISAVRQTCSNQRQEVCYTFEQSPVRQYLFVVGPLACDATRSVVLIVSLIPTSSGAYYYFGVYDPADGSVSSDSFQFTIRGTPQEFCFLSTIPLCKDRGFHISSNGKVNAALLGSCDVEALRWFDSVLAKYLRFQGFCNFVNLSPLQRGGLLYDPCCPSAPYVLKRSSQVLCRDGCAPPPPLYCAPCDSASSACSRSPPSSPRHSKRSRRNSRCRSRASSSQRSHKSSRSSLSSAEGKRIECLLEKLTKQLPAAVNHPPDQRMQRHTQH